jgi:uncharacterized protein YbaR (Trm112 family)
VLNVFRRRSGGLSGLPRVRCFDKVAFAVISLRYGGFGMAVRQDLLDILVCPLCKAPVKLLADGSGLKCQACKRVYPIRDDIPVMLPEEAKIATD